MSVELINTRVDDGENYSYSHAMMEGLAAEGGLFTPQEINPLDESELRRMMDMTYQEMAFEIVSHFGDLDPSFARELVETAYAPDVFRRQEYAPDEVTPVVELEDDVAIVELFHGPTYAFKDLALQLVVPQVDREAAMQDKRLTIVTATSGDTGSAAEHPVSTSENLEIVTLSPPDMSDVQKGQMGKLTGPNVLNLTVEGNFDDCQALVKKLNSMSGFEDLGALNSINWARVVAQVPYYISAYKQIIEKNENMEYGDLVDFVVPSGNFGNILAGYVSKKLGLPIRELVIATNDNDVLHDAVRTGVYREWSSDEVVATDSPSMDIAASSNFERLAYWMFDGDVEKVNDFLRQAKTADGANLGDYVASGNPYALYQEQGFFSSRSSWAERKAAMRRAHRDSGVFIDPHTATGVYAAFGRAAVTFGVPQVVMSTASIHKFEDTVAEATGARLPERPADLRGIEEFGDRYKVIPVDIDILARMVDEFRAR